MPVWGVIDTPHERSNAFMAAGILCSPPLRISAYKNDHRRFALNIGRMKGTYRHRDSINRVVRAGIPDSVAPGIGHSVHTNRLRPNHPYPNADPRGDGALDPDYSEAFSRGTVFVAYPAYIGHGGELGPTSRCDCGLPHGDRHTTHHRGHPHEELGTVLPKRHNAMQGTQRPAAPQHIRVSPYQFL